MTKSSPGGVSLSTMLAEIGKLKAITAFGLPGNLFAGIAPLVLKEWRDQAMTESPSHTRGHPVELRIALLSALLYCRRREITDALVNLLLSTVHRIGALPEPVNLGRLKKAIAQRWGMLPLIDVVKEAVLRSGCLQVIETKVGRGGKLGPEALLERLLLVLYAYGTDAGVRAVAAGEHGYSEHDLYYVRRWHLTAELAEALAIQIANATFAARQRPVWGVGSSAVSSDSTHFGAWDQNIFTEWHSGRGVLIYWHVERKSVVVHSQLLNCTASEVAAMIDGAIHHGTEMDVKANYVDTHGHLVTWFGLTRLLSIDLLPRIKRINHLRLYLPGWEDRQAYGNLAPALVQRDIDWDLIGQQYDDMMKYAASIRNKTATTTAILRRFHRANRLHPTYQAMQEAGRAQRTIFVLVTWNQTEGTIMLSAVSPRAEERCWARWCWRRSGRSWGGTSKRLAGCASGLTLAGRLGRSMRTPAGWPSTSTGVSGRASTRWKRPGSMSPVTSASSARARAAGAPASCRSTRARGWLTPRSSSGWCRFGCSTTT